MFNCGNCYKKFQSVAVYLTHTKNLHGHDPFSKYICGFNGCPEVYSTFRGFKSHLFHHKELQSHKSSKFICPSCKFSTYLKTQYISHFKQHSIITCPIKQCLKNYNVFSSFTSHLSRNHPCFVPFDVKPVENASNSIDTASTSISIEDETEIVPENEDSSSNFDDYKKMATLFILQMQEKLLLPNSTVSSLVEGMTDLANASASLMKHKIIKAVEKQNAEESVLHSISNTELSFEINSIFQNVKSDHQKKKYMKSLGLVSPTEYKLGSTSKYQYVSVIKNLQMFCRNPEIQKYILVPHERKPTVLQDHNDGSTCKKNPVFQITPNIQLIFYFDEFGLTNPLRGNQSKQKLAGIYYTLGNLPVSLRSKVNDVQVAIICKSEDIKSYGFSAILSPLIEDLKILESEGIRIDGIPGLVKGGILSIVGDNLGSHQIGGFTSCFSGNLARCCRFCLGTVNEMQNNFVGKNFTRRTKEMHINHLNLINLDPSYSSLYGVKFDSPFNELQYFHTSYMLPPDVMHDLLEGILPMEIGLILHKLIELKFCTLSNVNKKISSTVFGANDILTKPYELSKKFHKGVRMTASRMWTFIRFLPLFMGSNIPENNKYWELLLILKDIVDIVLAPIIDVSSVELLHDLIMDHHMLFKELFPTVKLLPKHHFLVHYPHLILEFGPLTSFWAMRFEAKHLYFKHIAQTVKNTKNLPYSLVQRHQQLQCYLNAQSSRHVEDKHTVSGAVLLNKSLYSEEIANFLDGYESFYTVKKFKNNSIIYKPGMCLPYEFHNEELLIAKIIIIICKSSTVLFLCRLFSTCPIFHIRGLKLNNSLNLQILSLSELLDHYPLSVYKYKHFHIVLPKYHLCDSKK